MSSHTTSNDPSKVSGNLRSTKGSTKETLGKAVGSTNLRQSGMEDRMSGEAEVNAARAQNYGEGTADRVGGKKDEWVGSLTGDQSQRAQGNIRQEKGHAQQEFNK